MAVELLRQDLWILSNLAVDIRNQPKDLLDDEILLNRKLVGD